VAQDKTVMCANHLQTDATEPSSQGAMERYIKPAQSNVSSRCWLARKQQRCAAWEPRHLSVKEPGEHGSSPVR